MPPTNRFYLNSSAISLKGSMWQSMGTWIDFPATGQSLHQILDCERPPSSWKRKLNYGSPMNQKLEMTGHPEDPK